MKDDPGYCPDCGQRHTVYVIERITASIDEVKIACSCELCKNLWYMIRSAADETQEG